MATKDFATNMVVSQGNNFLSAQPQMESFDVFESVQSDGNKISVNSKDWYDFASKNGGGALNQPFTMVGTDLQTETVQNDVVKVTPTALFRDFLADRNIEIPTEIYIRPSEYKFVLNDRINPVFLEEDVKNQQQVGSKKGKILLAALVAAVLLLK